MAEVRVTGIIRNNKSGNSFTLLEDYFVEIKGEKKHWQRRWQVWMTESHAYADDERLTIEGELGTKVDTWDSPNGTKQTVSHSINNPKVVERIGSVARTVDLDDLAKYGNAPF